MIKVEGIILNIKKYKNADCVFNILTKDKLIPVLGRGTLSLKSKTNKLNHPFISGEFDLYEGPTKGFKLRDCKIDKYFYNLFSTYEDLMIFNFINELIYKIVFNSDEFSGYYDTILNFFGRIANKQNLYNSVVDLFIKLLKINGLSLNFNSCTLCGNENNEEFIGISLENGGVICKKHDYESNDVCVLNKDELSYLEITFSNNDVLTNIELNKDEFLNIISFLSIFLEKYLDIKLNSLKLLKTI